MSRRRTDAVDDRASSSPADNAERNFGGIFARNLRPYRDDNLISSKSGYGMWEGPYDDFMARKYLIGSLDKS